MTERNPTTADLVHVIEQERAAWHDLIAEVGEARMEEPGPMGEWTFKDLAAHLTGWRSRSLDRLEAEAGGEPEPAPPWPPELHDDDPINDWIREQNRHRPAGDVLADADATFDRLRRAVEALPEEAVWSPDHFPWTEGAAIGQAIVDRTFFGHFHEEHEPAVRAWLSSVNHPG
ncbi:MAG: ClbS/DfsB family four-helix bundle protein [Chloroflexia bacterium]|nr:ClbS/DfsB family four-helix bundle protein [Chloroflexia bacterium]